MPRCTAPSALTLFDSSTTSQAVIFPILLSFAALAAHATWRHTRCKTEAGCGPTNGFAYATDIMAFRAAAVTRAVARQPHLRRRRAAVPGITKTRPSATLMPQSHARARKRWKCGTYAYCGRRLSRAVLEWASAKTQSRVCIRSATRISL